MLPVIKTFWENKSGGNVHIVELLGSFNGRWAHHVFLWSETGHVCAIEEF